MKKIFILAIIMITAFAVIGCDTTKNVSTETSEQAEVVTQTPEQTTIDVSEVPIVSNTPDGTESNNFWEDSSSSIASYGFEFLTIKDMHTYITTGSTDLSDYSGKPYTSFDMMKKRLPSEVVLKMGYKPLSDFFDYDESEFEYTDALYMITEEKWLALAYTLDNVNVIVWLPSNKEHGVKTALEYCKKYQKKPYIPYENAVDFEKISSVNKGYVTRNIDGNQILYLIDEGVKKEAFIYVDGYLINILLNIKNGQTANDCYLKFMTEEKYSSFAALFSDDEQVAKSAISKLTD